jgi:hypothetical protein
MKLLITGGCGFIGSAVVRRAVASGRDEIVNLDKMTYAVSEDALAAAGQSPRHVLLRADICDAAVTRAAFAEHQPDAVMLSARRRAQGRAARPGYRLARCRYAGFAAAGGHLRADHPVPPAQSRGQPGRGGLPHGLYRRGRFARPRRHDRQDRTRPDSPRDLRRTRMKRLCHLELLQAICGFC